MNKRLIYRVAAAAAALSIAACSSSIKLDDPAPVEDRSNMPADGSAAAGAGAGSASTNPAGSSRPVAQVTLDTKDPLQDPNSPLSRRSIYFDFDSFAIKDEYRSTLDALAWFYPRLVRGGLLVTHDYGDVTVPGVKQAFDEFFADKPETVIPLWFSQAVVTKL